MKQDRTLPGAILLGSIIIALGLYFGLRKDDGDGPARGRGAEAQVGPGDPGRAARGPAGAPPQAAAPGAAPPAGGGVMGSGLGMPPVSGELRATVEASAVKAFEAERANFRKTCWDPAVKQAPEPPTSKFVFNVTFDGATGKEISRGINELRNESRSDVAQCLRTLPIGVVIEPVGVNVNVDVPITLP
ncbi:MAG TPA: hypothetical protein VE093_46260 [Polyangiaceae bacterium]|nr:hypothetical protein [Polyangiaceae bacterium]